MVRRAARCDLLDRVNRSKQMATGRSGLPEAAKYNASIGKLPHFCAACVGSAAFHPISQGMLS